MYINSIRKTVKYKSLIKITFSTLEAYSGKQEIHKHQSDQHNVNLILFLCVLSLLNTNKNMYECMISMYNIIERSLLSIITGLMKQSTPKTN